MGYNPTLDYGSPRPPRTDRAKDVFHRVAGDWFQVFILKSMVIHPIVLHAHPGYPGAR